MNLANMDCAINAKEEGVGSRAETMGWGRDWKNGMGERSRRKMENQVANGVGKRSGKIKWGNGVEK